MHECLSSKPDDETTHKTIDVKHFKILLDIQMLEQRVDTLIMISALGSLND